MLERLERSAMLLGYISTAVVGFLLARVVVFSMIILLLLYWLDCHGVHIPLSVVVTVRLAPLPSLSRFVVFVWLP